MYVASPYHHLINSIIAVLNRRIRFSNVLFLEDVTFITKSGSALSCRTEMSKDRKLNLLFLICTSILSLLRSTIRKLHFLNSTSPLCCNLRKGQLALKGSVSWLCKSKYTSTNSNPNPNILPTLSKESQRAI